MTEVDKSLRVCSKCVTNDLIRLSMEKQGTTDPCSFGCTGGRSVALLGLAKVIDDIVEAHFWPENPDDPDDSAVLLPELLMKRLGVSETLAKKLDSILTRREPALYSYSLVLSQPWGNQRWEDFKKHIKEIARFLDPSSVTTLNDLLGGLRTFAGGKCFRVLSKGTRLFRARLGPTSAEADRYISEGASGLGPPRLGPSVPAGRMNSAGIPAFYGATQLPLAAAEVRPWVGSTVVVAPFETTRDIEVLDLTVLPSPYDVADLFSSGFSEALRTIGFLRSIEFEMREPVSPNDAPTEYIPTQVMSEYFARNLKVDGVIFRSAQVPNDDSEWRNIVLFREPGLTHADPAGVSSFPLIVLAKEATLHTIRGVNYTLDQAISFVNYPAVIDPDADGDDN